MTRGRNLLIGAAFLALLVALGFGQTALEKVAAAQAKGTVQAPRFEVDPMWPKPLPNHWVLGSTIGVSVDAQDHVWIIHRGSSTLGNNEKGLELNPPTGECCGAAPPILEFDAAGNLVGHFGGPGPGYEWPESNHGVTVDFKGNVWIGGNGGGDSQILKFTKDGKFLLQVGKANARRVAAGSAAARGAAPVEGAEGAPAGRGRGGAAAPAYAGGSNDPVSFGRVAKIFVDPKTNEVYLADGYLNKRVAVLDGDTGKMKRWWGAYGNKPDDTPLGRYTPEAPPAQQFRGPVHCAMLSNDNLVYVCDRQSDRIQVFQPDGKFVKEMFIAKASLGEGSAWDLDFSKDAAQKYIYLADGRNMKVRIIDRQSMTELTSFGDGGRQPGQFYAVHSIAVDSKGNIYTTETYEGKRLQKFTYKGMGSVAATQGVVWPK